jgi:hypothetical protein
MSGRLHSRQTNGRFRRSTLANTFGLANEICDKCGQCHPYTPGSDKPPSECEHCGEYLPWYLKHMAELEAAQDAQEAFYQWRAMQQGAE